MKKQYTTPSGIFIADSDRQKKMVQYLSRNRNNQQEELDFLASSITAHSVVVDVGANIGTLAIPFAKIAQTVLAFEPVPENLRLLRENIGLNKVTNVVVYGKALG